jgi:hypothetical protein
MIIGGSRQAGGTLADFISKVSTASDGRARELPRAGPAEAGNRLRLTVNRSKRSRREMKMSRV